MFKVFLLYFLIQARAETLYRLESYFSYSNNVLADTFINPGNQILQLPSEAFAADIRAEVKWRDDRNQIVLRPRYQAEKSRIVTTGLETEKNESDWNVTDAFWETQVSDDFTLTSGLQVYQWGPAELINPSNPIFHFTSRQKSFGYKEKGKALIRANSTFGRSDSLVVILEPVSNNEAPWTEGDFVPKAAIKYEHQVDDSASQIGVVAGQEEKENAFFGTYFNWQLSEAVSFYADGKTTRKEIGYKPVAKGVFSDLEHPVSAKQWPVLAVGGLRWEGDYDLRLEYIYNSAGYSEEEWQYVLNSVGNPLNPNYSSNLERFQKPGLELPGRQYVYFSYRVTEPFQVKDLSLYLRDLYSLQDFSSQAQFEFDKAISDSWVMFGSLTGASGRKETEFKLLNSWQTLVGVKWVQ